jgi:hypothetical protein
VNFNNNEIKDCIQQSIEARAFMFIGDQKTDGKDLRLPSERERSLYYFVQSI